MSTPTARQPIADQLAARRPPASVTDISAAVELLQASITGRPTGGPDA